ncbi:MAG: helix-turn-helix domain-containing protein [Sphingobacterium sp.]
MYIVETTKEKRKANKSSQEDIAKVLGVTVGYIGQIESKKLKSMYSYGQLNKLARYFDCSPKDFMPEKAVED